MAWGLIRQRKARHWRRVQVSLWLTLQKTFEYRIKVWTKSINHNDIGSVCKSWEEQRCPQEHLIAGPQQRHSNQTAQNKRVCAVDPYEVPRKAQSGLGDPERTMVRLKGCWTSWESPLGGVHWPGSAVCSCSKWMLIQKMQDISPRPQWIFRLMLEEKIC